MKKHDDGRDLTRAELAKSVGRTKSTIRRWERSGKITPTKNESGAHVFRLADVQQLIGDRPIERLAQARTHVPSAANVGGDLAAEIFDRLDRRVHPIEIVKQLRVHPDVVMGLASRWSRLRKGLILAPDEAKAITDAVGVSQTRDVSEFVVQVQGRAAFWGRRCRRCKDRRASYCVKCVRGDERGIREARSAAHTVREPDNDDVQGA